jgi:hypothetical protein
LRAKSNPTSTDSAMPPFASCTVSVSSSFRKLSENDSIGTSDSDPLTWYEVTSTSAMETL